jgi:hypothetical protein
VRRHAKAPSAGSIEGSGNARGRLALLAILLAFVAFAASAPAAGAALAPGYGSIAYFNPEVHTGPIAVEDATGNIFVADYSGNRVRVFAPDLGPGGTASLLTEIAVNLPAGIAIDQTTGAVYVSEQGGSGLPPADKIERFLSDGAPVPTYTADPTFASPALASYEGPLAVDPTTHDLLVGIGDHVDRYSTAGVLLDSFDGSDSPQGKFTRAADLAIGSAGEVYILNISGDPSAGSGISYVDQFDPSGTYVRILPIRDVPVAIALDPSGRLLTVGRTHAGDGGGQLATVDEDGLGSLGNILPSPAIFISRIAVDGGGSGRVYVGVSGSPFLGTPENGVSILLPGPGVRLGASSSSGSEAIHLTATVNPQGKEASARFEYCSERDPCAKDATLPWQQGPDHALAAGPDDEAVSEDIAGLLPHTTYSVRIAATHPDTGATVYSRPATVTTADAAPVAVTGTASDVSTTAATLTGTVNPLGIQSTFYFEYGPSAAYGSTTADGVLGNAFAPRAVSRPIAGLSPGATYHYRVVGVNAAGTSYGDDRTFTIESTAPAPRAYEMVSPIEKQGVPIDPGYGGFRASADGDAILYGTAKSAYPGSEVSSVVPRVLAERSPTGWINTPTGLPLDNLGPPGGLLFFDTLAASSDARSALVVSDRALAPGAVPGELNLYIRTPGAVAPARELRLVATDPRLGALLFTQGPFNLVGTSDDLRTTVFTADDRMFQAVEGQGVSEVSIMPDGTPTSGPVSNSLDPGQTDPHQVSTDGSHVYFNVGNNPGGPLYLRENADRPQSAILAGECSEPDKACTIPISVSHRPGAPTAPVGAYFIGASPDGRYVEFTTNGFGPVEGLTPDAPDGPGVYRYDVLSDSMEFLTSNAGSGTVPRPELGALLFLAGAPSSVYLARDGETRKIADLTDPYPPTVTRASPNGRYYTFVSNTKLTAYDNSGHNEVYLYDAETEELSCPSCRTDGGPARGEVQMGTEPSTNQSIFARYKARAVLDDGTVFFDTPDPLVGSDGNGTRDVYSYRDGKVTLISRGVLPTESYFLEATPDGSNVYFSTDDRLVAQDRDNTTDLYDARIGGGIAAQNALPAGECGGEDCRGAGTPAPLALAGGSETVRGPGDHSARKKKRAGKHAKKHRAKKRAKHRGKSANGRAADNRGGGK